MKLVNLLVISALLTMISNLALSQETAPARYEPEKTIVAILPVYNLSGEKDASQKIKQAENAEKELYKRFLERGFVPADTEAVKRTIANLKIDLSDEEQHKRSNLYAISKELKANLIIFVVITDVSQRTSANIFSTTKEGKAKLKAWLLDVDHETSIFSAKVHEGKSGGGHFGALEKGSERIVLACANGVRDMLKEFFKAYPIVKKL
jgi:hypothetical protein